MAPNLAQSKCLSKENWINELYKATEIQSNMNNLENLHWVKEASHERAQAA